jgi:hypothetical protein
MDEGHFTESRPNGRLILYGNGINALSRVREVKESPEASDRVTLKVRILPAKGLAQRML